MHGLLIAICLAMSAPTPSARKEAIIIMNEGVDLASKGDNVRAQAKLRAATKADPKYAHAWLNLGVVLQREGATSEATSAFKTGFVHAEGKVKDELQYRLATTAYHDAMKTEGARQDKRAAVERALERLDEATKAWPKRSDAQLYRARCHEFLDQPKEADEAYREAILADPHNVRAVVGLGLMYIDYGHANVGMAVLDTGAKVNDKDAVMWSGLGRAHLLLDKPLDAIDAFKKAKTIDPDHLPAHYGLGMAHAEARQRKEAVEALGEFLRLAGSDVPETLKKSANDTIARMQDVI